MSPNTTRGRATIATTMPAMTQPGMDLGIVDCELAKLELDETLPAVIVVVAKAVSAGVLKTVALAKVESEVEVEVDEGPCENESASASSKHTKPRFQRTACNDTDCNISVAIFDVELLKIIEKDQ